MFSQKLVSITVYDVVAVDPVHLKFTYIFDRLHGKCADMYYMYRGEGERGFLQISCCTGPGK